MSNTPILFLAILCVLLCPIQCKTQNPTVQGNIELTPSWHPVLYLVQPRSLNEMATSFSGVVVDSAQIDAAGHFVFEHLPQLDEPVLYQICIQKKGSRFTTQLLDEQPTEANYIPIIVQKNTKITLKAHADQLQASARLLQSDGLNQSLLHLRDIRQQAFEQEKLLLLPDSTHDEAHLLQRADALLRFRQPLMAFADTCTQLLPVLLAVRWVSPESDYERVPEFVVEQCQKWSKKYPDNRWVAQLCQLGNSEKLPLLMGDIIPNFPLPAATGDTVLLHQILGKRITVLDIWASWCAPCRRENRDVLVPIWAKYQEKGLQIIGYAIDSNPGAWKIAIAKDAANWPHFSHLSGDATPFMDALRLTTIPANFILDAEGKIIAKNLHGDELKTFVAEWLEIR